MSTLRQMALILFVVGIIGLFFPSVFPGVTFIKWGVIAAIILVVIEYLNGRRV